jgi:rod shape-determining protein MreC
MKLSIKKGGNWRNILLFAVLAAVIIFALNFYQKPVRNFFYLISAPIQKTLWRLGDRVSNFFEAISGIQNLKKENEDLKVKIQSLTAENVSLKELGKENATLRTALNLGLEKEFKLTLAQVIGKDISQDSLIIDRGSKDGVLKNQPVITEQKSLVGRISEVYENFSKVMLITNKDSTFDGKISETEIYPVRDYQSEEKMPREQISNGVYSLVKGYGNFKVFFDLVPKDKEIKKGDIIVTAATGGIFPEGLLVGEIKEVQKSDVEPFQKVEISPSLDIKEINYLFVISGWQER